MGKLFGKHRTLKSMANAGNTNNSEIVANGTNTQATETAEQKALRLASAVTDNGRTTQSVNNTTNTEAASENIDDLSVYINDMRNRRKKRGAPMGQIQEVLGQPTMLGI